MPRLLAVLTLFLFLGAAFNSAAAEPDQHETGYFGVVVENDVFVSDRDRHFSSGIRLDLVPRKEMSFLGLNGLMKRLMGSTGASRQFLSLGQDMHTPEDLSRTDLISDDVPYAGWLYLTVGRSRTTDSYTERLSLTIGVIGPASLAGKLQYTWHAAFNFNEPRGWQNQLRNEPGLNLFYQRRWRVPLFVAENGFELRLSPAAQVALGNIFVHAGGNMLLQIGKNLPKDASVPQIHPGLAGPSYAGDGITTPEAFGWFAYLGFSGRGVAHNIFLDGNTFRNSHSVAKYHFVADLQAGIVLHLPKLGFMPPARLGFGFMQRGKEFVGQRGANKMGQVILTFAY